MKITTSSQSTLQRKHPGLAARALVSGMAGALLALTGCAAEIEADDTPAAEDVLIQREIIERSPEILGELKTEATRAEEPALDPDQPASAVSDDPAASPYDEQEPTFAAPLAATVELAGDVVVDYYDHFDGSVGVLVKGPARSNLDGALAQVQASIEGASTGAEAARALETLRGEAAATGRSAPSGDAAGATPPALTNGPTTPSVYCGGVSAGGSGTLHANAGDCTQYHRDAGEQTYWQSSDSIAFAVHVSSIDGAFIWEIEKQNWNGGSWYFALENEFVDAGQQAYYFNANKDNDFNVHSMVLALDDSSDHYHDFARCHDWNARTVWTSSAAGGCGIVTGVVTPVERFCAEASEYWGVDPSNIFTSGYYDGGGGPWSC